MGERINSPFKFLDSFTLEDQDVFFGRDKEVDTLYEYINMNKLVLVYGGSGTGKTSLVQCGLAGRFDITDWYPIYIRRQGNILDSFEQELRKAAKSSYRDDWVETLRRMNARYLRPTYLIFDQFEELLILGEEEQEVLPFIERLTAILQADDLGCHILLILREEYIARLYQFEKNIPTLFDRRLRVEPMTLVLVAEVIRRSCEEFNIRFENPEVNVQQIIDNLSAGRSGIALPYLQVYLDMLYREDYKKTYADEAPGKPLPELEFTTAEIATFGEIDDILERFLREQTEELQAEISTQIPGVSRELIRQVLDSFVTEEGTKKVIPFSIKDDDIQLDPSAPDDLLALEPELLNLVLKNLEARRILRANEQVYELAHDSLANLIDKNRSDEQRQLNEIKNRIRNGYAEYLRSGVCFTDRQLLSIEEYLPKLELPDTYQDFIRKSWEQAEALKLKEQSEQQEKLLLTEQRLVAERKLRKRQRLVSVVIGLAAIIAIVSGLIVNANNQKLSQTNIDLVGNNAGLRIQAAILAKSEKRYDTALELLKESEKIIRDNEYEKYFEDTLSAITTRYANYETIKKLVNEAEQLSSLDRSKDFARADTAKLIALQKYQLAIGIEKDSGIESDIKNLEQIIKNLAADLLENAKTQYNSRAPALALESLSVAKKLDPDNAEIQRLEREILKN